MSEFTPLDNNCTKSSDNRGLSLWISQLLYTIKWRSCIFGIIFGCVVTSCIAVCILLLILPHLKPEQHSPPTLARFGHNELKCSNAIYWEACSVTCGKGQQIGFLNITCQNEPYEKSVWNKTIRRDCMEKYCPVDGGWTDWKQITSCSVTCGVGIVTLLRQCSNPQPKYGGRMCDGHQFGLGFCNLSPCKTSINIALKKNSTQSTTKKPAERWGSQLAVDGKIVTSKLTVGQPKCTHTNAFTDKMSWWAVDLGDVFKIRNVIIYGRTDCCGDRLTNFSVEAIMPDCFEENSWSIFDNSNVQNVRLCHYQKSELPNHILNATCKAGTVGKYVRIKLHEKNVLTLCEVQVYGTITWPFLAVQEFVNSQSSHSKGENYGGQLVESFHLNNDKQCSELCDTQKICESTFYVQPSGDCFFLTKRNNSDAIP